MWKQRLFGEFTNGIEQIKIDCLDTEHYLIWKNGEFEKEAESFEQVQDYLKKHDIEEIRLPDVNVEENKWYSFGGNEHYEEIFTRKLASGLLQSVIICHYESKNNYGVLMRTCSYEWIESLASASFEFAEEKGRMAKDILELDAYEAGTHGSSGMEACHYDLQTREEVNALIKEKYGIE